MRHEVVELPPDQLTEQADRRPRPLGRGGGLGHGGGYGVPGGAGGEAAQAAWGNGLGHTGQGCQMTKFDPQERRGSNFVPVPRVETVKVTG